jgi:hypothetical protein
VTTIVACRHYVNGELQPCPPMCPTQCWPRSRFRFTFWRQHLVPREKIPSDMNVGSTCDECGVDRWAIDLDRFNGRTICRDCATGLGYI